MSLAHHPTFESSEVTAPQLASVPVEPELKQPGRLESLPAETAKDLVGLFKLLSDETRLRILSYLLQSKELNVRTLCEYLGQSQPAVSHHLALLKASSLVDCRRDGKHNFYRIVPETAANLLGTMFASTPGIESNQLSLNTHVLRLDRAEGYTAS
ncbi:MAG: transcriptional regulator [Blastopirellula sp.]|nr:MAG: transcriptional regulator [Blastopirellula sp.]